MSLQYFGRAKDEMISNSYLRFEILQLHRQVARHIFSNTSLCGLWSVHTLMSVCKSLIALHPVCEKAVDFPLCRGQLCVDHPQHITPLKKEHNDYGAFIKHYSLLGIPITAETEEVITAYRDCIR